MDATNPHSSPSPSPLAQLARSEVFPGVLLVTATAVAILIANLPIASEWQAFWFQSMEIRIGHQGLTKSLAHWVNDGLMVLFFFFVGLELKHEVGDGELGSLRRAALPIAAAIGGMAVPAILYVAVITLRGGNVTEFHGWGIPMATDIAFALGVLALLGRRVPPAIKVFLATLAIVDDLGAVLVIALFYTEQIAWPFLVVGLLILALSQAANRLGVRSTWPYVLFGVAIWLTFLGSGVHATVAGAALAATVPARRELDEREFSRRARELITEFDHVADPTPRTNAAQLVVVHELQRHAQAVQAPLQRMAHGLSSFVSRVIVPLFALANAGVNIQADSSELLGNYAAQGVFVGLLIGKPLGVLLAVRIAIRFFGCSLPQGVSWSHMRGAACLAGIGFTMSLFIDGLAFASAPVAYASSKVAVLAASSIAGMLGFALLWRIPPATP